MRASESKAHESKMDLSINIGSSIIAYLLFGIINKSEYCIYSMRAIRHNYKD